METYRSNLTNRTYRIESRIESYINPDTGIKSLDYVMVRGYINGLSQLLDSPVSRERIQVSSNNMIHDLELFLDGSHNISHYHDFPEFQAGVK